MTRLKDPAAQKLGRKGGLAMTPEQQKARRRNVRAATSAALEARPCYGILGGAIYRFRSPSARADAGADPVLARDPRVTKAQRLGQVREH